MPIENDDSRSMTLDEIKVGLSQLTYEELKALDVSKLPIDEETAHAYKAQLEKEIERREFENGERQSIPFDSWVNTKPAKEIELPYTTKEQAESVARALFSSDYANEVCGFCGERDRMKLLQSSAFPCRSVCVECYPKQVNPTPIRVALLEKGIGLTTGSRNKTHGDFAEQHRTAAKLWSAWLSARLKQPIEVTAHDVAECLSLLKKSRKAHGQTNEDDYVDDAVYSTGSYECLQSENSINNGVFKIYGIDS